MANGDLLSGAQRFFGTLFTGLGDVAKSAPETVRRARAQERLNRLQDLSAILDVARFQQKQEELRQRENAIRESQLRDSAATDLLLGELAGLTQQEAGLDISGVINSLGTSPLANPENARLAGPDVLGDIVRRKATRVSRLQAGRDRLLSKNAERLDKLSAKKSEQSAAERIRDSFRKISSGDFTPDDVAIVANAGLITKKKAEELAGLASPVTNTGDGKKDVKPGDASVDRVVDDIRGDLITLVGKGKNPGRIEKSIESSIFSFGIDSQDTKDRKLLMKIAESALARISGTGFRRTVANQLNTTGESNAVSVLKDAVLSRKGIDGEQKNRLIAIIDELFPPGEQANADTQQSVGAGRPLRDPGELVNKIDALLLKKGASSQ